MAQIALGVALLGVWEWAGAATGSHWVNRPSLIAERLTEWFAGEIYIHLWSTTVELVCGLVIGLEGRPVPSQAPSTSAVQLTSP